MDHLNIFNPFRNKSNNHEDELTRGFLILLKNIPLVQIMFFELVREALPDIGINSIATGDLCVSAVHTQLTNTNSIFESENIEGKTLVSVIISDDKLDTTTTVQNDDRTARYDGVVFCDPSWLFIIENKPSKDNIWLGQLNPNISEELDVIIEKKPCCLSWRTIMARINELMEKELVFGLERTLIDNFIEYVDEEYDWINPFTKFAICKDNSYLLNKRCNNALSNLIIDNKKQNIEYHKGWKHFIKSDKNTIKQIALDSNRNGSTWTIDLWLYAGDTMTGARDIFQKLKIDEVLELEDQGFEISENFHVAYRSSNLLFFFGKFDTEDYLRYWVKNVSSLKQAKRDQFDDLFKRLEKDKIIMQEDFPLIQEKIMNKKYDKLNICPGFLIKYSWDKQTAIELDKKSLFEADLVNKIKTAFSVIGDDIRISV